jgi:hypothetical protein
MDRRVIASAAVGLVAGFLIGGPDLRRALAPGARIFVGALRHPGRRVYPYVVNASDFSIYEAQLWYLSTDGQSVTNPDAEYLGTILPGEDPYAEQDFTSVEARSRTILTFRDANSVRWIRMPGGVLDEQSAASPGDEVSARLPVPLPGTQPGGAG